MSNYIYNGGELCHYGVKGMKWGVRRYQNSDGSLTPAGKKRYGEIGPDRKVKSRDIKNERHSLRKKYMEQTEEYSKANKLKSQAYALAEKYDFDGDDGGGGSTAASRKAGAKYMDLWNDIDALETEAYTKANKRATNEIIKKYGEKRVNSINRADTAKGVAAVAGFFTLPIALAVVPEILRR
jgi:hypothetical protein